MAGAGGWWQRVSSLQESTEGGREWTEGGRELTKGSRELTESSS